MKAFIFILGVLSTSASFAQVTADTSKLPLCDEGVTNVPCRFDASLSHAGALDMIFANAKGFNEIRTKSPGLQADLTGGFMIDDVRVSILKQEQSGRYNTHSVVLYEILLLDCRGTDACFGSFLWTVTEETDSDGYSSHSEFTNKLEKTELRELNPEN